MSFGGDEEAGVGYSTARGRDWPSVRQFNVFLENRLGALLELVRRFETTDNRIVSLTVVDSADCAIIRIVLRDPERAREIFEQARLPVTESDLLVVQLPDGPQPLLQICKALLMAELNVHYAYPLLIGPLGNAALALHVDPDDDANNIRVVGDGPRLWMVDSQVRDLNQTVHFSADPRDEFLVPSHAKVRSTRSLNE